MAKRTTQTGTASRGSRAAGPAAQLDASVRLALFYGEETYLIQSYTEQLRHALQAALGEVEVVRFDGRTASVAQVLDECRSFGLMSSHKLVIVDEGKEWLSEDDDGPATSGAARGGDSAPADDPSDAGPADQADGSGGSSEEPGEDTQTIALFGAPAPPAAPAPAASKPAARVPAARRALRNRELVERYAQSPSENATLVIRGKGIVPGRLTAAFEPHGVVLKCDPIGPAEAVSMLRQQMQARHGRPLPAEAAEALVERVGTQLGRLMHEVDKLALAVDADRPITVDDVVAMTGLTREQQNWEIKKALLAGDYPATLALIHELMTVSRTPVLLIRWNFLDLAKALYALGESVAGRGSANPRALRLRGEEERRAMAIARRAPLAQLRELLDAAIEADYRAKTGRGHEIRALELLALRFAQLPR